MKNINRFGEVYYDKNEALVTMPFNRLGIEEIELLEENYRNKIKEIGYPDTFIYANNFSVIRDRFQMSYDLDGCVDFHHIHKYRLKDMLPYLYSMVELAKQDVNVLWQKSNMIIDVNEQRVKALLFEFDGFKVYKKDNNVDGLKELIMLALTKNNSIIAKPKRADFIEKTDEVFQFSDDILSTNTINEIEAVINSYEKEIEYQQLKFDKEQEEKKQNSKFFAIKEKFKPTKKELNSDEIMKERLQSEANKKEDKEKSSTSFLDKITSPVGMVTIIGLLLVFGVLFTTTDLTTASSEVNDVENELAQTDKIIEAYRLYVSNDEDKRKQAYAKLDSIGYDKLPEKDKSILINWYIEQEQYTKAITIAPDSAYQISDKIVSESEGDKEYASSQLETLQGSFQDSDVLKFDLANMQNDYQAMIENSKLKKYNDKRAQGIVKAYVLTNQVEELDNLIDEYKDDEESYQTLQSHYSQYVDKYKKEREAKEKLENLTSELDKKEKKLSDEKDKDKKEELKKDIKELNKKIDKKKEEIKKVKESIKTKE